MKILNLNEGSFPINFSIKLETVDVPNIGKLQKDLLIEAMRSSATTLKGVAANLLCYFDDVKTYNQKAIDKFIGNSDKILVDLKKRIHDLETWDESSLDNLLLKYREENNLPVPKVNQPIRIALTGSTNSPSLGTTLYLFNKEEVIARINNLIDYIH